MKNSSFVCMKDIAARARVSVMTVSRALKGDRNVLPATREKILKIADELGYRPDPVLKALIVHRQKIRTPADFTTIAFVTNFPRKDDWKRFPAFRHFYEGATRRALQLGYKVEPFWLRGEARSHKRASNILYHRGIKGLLIAPLAAASGHLNLDLAEFSSVVLGPTLANPPLHYVSHDHFHAMRTIWHHLRRLGYHRIGLAQFKGREARVRYRWYSAHLLEQEQHWPGQHRIPTLMMEKWSAEDFLKWYRAHKLDVIISLERFRPFLAKENIRIPQDVGMVHLEVSSAEQSGIMQHSDHIGMQAMNKLHSMLLHGERGVPEMQQSILIQGTWNQGTSIRQSDRNG